MAYDIRTWVGFIILLLLTIGGWLYFKPAPIPPGITIEATPAKEVAKEETIPIITAPVQAFKPAVKRKLGLPKTVQDDAAKHVLASVKTANDERQHTVTTVLDKDTGWVSSYDRIEPLPWVSVANKSELFGGVGYDNHGKRVWALSGRQELLQLKGVHLGVTGLAIGQGGGVNAYLLAGAWYRW